jgi:hypothetical protein
VTVDLVDEFAQFVRVNSIDKVVNDLDWLCGQSRHFDVSEECGGLSSDLIRRAIEARAPLSLIRVGDGEGNILTGSRREFPALSVHSERAILRMMFGCEDFSPHQVDLMRADLEEAIIGADILGVSDAARLERMRLRLAIGHANLDVRGLSGSIESVSGVRRVLEVAGKRPGALVSNLVHRYMAGRYKSLFSGLDFLGYVAPYNLDALFLANFNVDRVEGYLIPNQASNGIGEGAKWFPAQYAALLDQLMIPHRGAVFLVAAGFLGKSICHHIKTLGGVGIDVGSMIDVWTGRGVRKYHDAAFIAAHRLGRPTLA